MNKLSKIVFGLTLALAMVIGGASTASAYTSYAQMNSDTGGFRFNQNFSSGMRNSDVAMLQRFLNIDSATTVAFSGAGSNGAETTFFGGLTKSAVIKFQNKYYSEVLAPNGLSAGTGFWGPSSRAKANALLASSPSPSPTYPVGCTSTAGFSSVNGQSCATYPYGPNPSATYPVGCTSTAGFSPSTGQSCSTYPNGPAPAGPQPVGCTSTAGFSSVNGQSCATYPNGTGTTPPPSGLSGGAGSVAEYKLLSSPSNNQEVGEDENDVKVLGLSVEADDGSDIEFTAIKIQFCDADDDTASADDCDDVDDFQANQDFDEYAQDVSIWLGSNEVARVDASDFTNDNDWTKTISLESGAIIRAGAVGNFYVAVSGISNLDSADDGEKWGVDVTSMRFVDAQGAIISEDPSITARTFTFETLATASDTNLKIALNSSDDEINDGHVIDVDNTDATENVAILSFTMKAEGTSDILVDEIPVFFTAASSTGGTIPVSDVISSADLYVNGSMVASEDISTVATSTTVTFIDLDWNIDAGSTDNFMVKVNFFATDESLNDGDTIMAEISATERTAIDAEDESGEQLAPGDRSGTAVGEASAVYDNGIQLTYVSSSAVKTENDLTPDEGEFKVTFKVTTFGDNDQFIDMSCGPTTTPIAHVPGEGTLYTITNSATATTTACVVTSSTTDSDDTATDFQVAEGTSRTFTLTVQAIANGAAFHEVALASVNWGTSSVGDNSNYYTFNLDEFKTSSLYLDTL